MVKKRQSLSDEIARSMEERTIGESSAEYVADKVTLDTYNNTNETQKKTKGYKNTVISIRFDEGDYERLKEIAREQGTNGAALIRKAVKDIIQAADSP